MNKQVGRMVCGQGCMVEARTLLTLITNITQGLHVTSNQHPYTNGQLAEHTTSCNDCASRTPEMLLHTSGPSLQGWGVIMMAVRKWRVVTWTH